ncbi:hypothetical protein OIU85_001365 [Salix viminalis]|uniref:Cupin type-1 domain-containing protein n=1 Tax=Salix viminalis TaxID=40686 RepID=A0A9Q0VNK1_SALVM|nr:hypothetical protein OIU85_001365 [Salix viminalis]
MEPRTVFIPQYIYSSLILFICQGNSDKLAERRLKFGDIYRIPDGSAFYLMNTDGGQRLHIICSIDPSESLGIGCFLDCLINCALQVTIDEVREMMTRQQEGPDSFLGDFRAPRPSPWTKFLQLKERDRVHHLKRLVKSHNHPIKKSSK